MNKGIEEKVGKERGGKRNREDNFLTCFRSKNMKQKIDS